jgi:hypothetical protein
MRCRGQVEVVRLAWTPQRITVTLRSAVAQTIELRLAGRAGAQNVALAPGREVTVGMTLQD